jgi:hypothetical protein
MLPEIVHTLWEVCPHLHQYSLATDQTDREKVDIHVVHGSRSCLLIIEEGALYDTSPRIPAIREEVHCRQTPTTLG